MVCIVSCEYHVPLHVLMQMSPYQIRKVYLRERDENGRIKTNQEPLGVQKTEKQLFYDWARLNRRREWEIEPEWKARHGIK